MNTTEKLLPETYTALSDLRKNDVYLPEMNQEQIISAFFPATFPELVGRLSEITGLFYGGMLKQAGVLYGDDAITKLSDAFMHDLGTKIVMRNKAQYPNLPQSISSLAKILVGTIFTSSPEYSFEFVELSDKKAEVLIKGIDRYHRIAYRLQIADQLEWPVLKPFIQGTCDAMGLDVNIIMDVKELKDDSSCFYQLIVEQNK
ncbi:hypothetical protein [Chryseobacterium sp. JUb7]|uniref:hypothetical protein n=1 Tax=Chryseobacterium sp. JUb7 TaxID=2940599 RepID=UPI002167EAE1|nr:hypothetical protein [Chryseobacterium sp. JUb7]MCS3529302.1 hypothetical protein [Chryseobacterium sp. JUb7]